MVDTPAFAARNLPIGPSGSVVIEELDFTLTDGHEGGLHLRLPLPRCRGEEGSGCPPTREGRIIDFSDLNADMVSLRVFLGCSLSEML